MKVTFYSPEELEMLKPYINKEQQVSKDNLADFCTQFNRKYLSVQAKIYSLRINSSSKKTLTMYSDEEMAELEPYISGEKKVSRYNLAPFCNKTKRNYKTVYQKILGKKKKFTPTVDSPVKDQAMIKKGQFIIPITKYDIQNIDGKMSLVLNF